MNEFRIRRAVRRVSLLKLAKKADPTYKDLKKLDKRTQQESDAPELNKELITYLKDKTRVYLVDGKVVRDLYNTDFSMGGHGYVYDFIPKDEVWVERMYSTEESRDILLHELYERQKMKNEDMSYEEAHTEATEFESKMRERNIPANH